MLPGTSYFREMCSCRRAVPVRRSTTRICRFAEKGGERWWQKRVRVRGVGGCSGARRGNGIYLPLFHSPVLSRSAVERDETVQDERGKVARNASATVRSPVPDEQIREYGRWKYRFRLEATADVLLVSPSSFTLYLSVSLFPFHSFVLRSNVLLLHCEKIAHARARASSSPGVRARAHVCIRVQIANPDRLSPQVYGDYGFAGDLTPPRATRRWLFVCLA